MQKEIKIELLTGVSPEEASKYILEPRRQWLMQVKDSVGNIPFFVYEGKEEGIIGLCIFMTYKANPGTAYLLYVSVKEEYRGQGYGSGLINKGWEYLKKRLGYSALETIFPLETQDISYLVKKGFREVRKEIYMTYNLPALRKSKLNGSLDRLEPLINKVKGLPEIPTDNLIKFKDLQKRKRKVTDITKFIPNQTEVFIDKGQILGYMAFSLYESQMITLIDYYISGAKEARYAYPAILGKATERAYSEDSDDFMIRLYVRDDQQYEALKELLGEPVEENRADILAIEL